MKLTFEILSAVAVAVFTLALIWRVLDISGLKLRARLPLCTRSAVSAYTPTRKTCTRIFIYAIIFRLAIMLIGFISNMIFTTDGSELAWSKFINGWLQWDARHYTKIMMGYGTEMVENDYSNLVFFPLFPWLMRLVHFVIPNPTLCGIVVSSVCYAFACVFVYKLFCIDYSSQTARRAVIFMSVFPFGFFYGAVMTESVFLLTITLTLYFTRKHDWISAGIAGLFAALSRSAGVLLIIPATIEFVEEYRLFSLKPSEAFLTILKNWTWLVLIPVGTLIYLLVNYVVAGDPFYFLDMESKYWNQVSQPFFKTVVTLLNIIGGGHKITVKMSAFIPGLFLLIAFYVCIGFSVRRHRSMYVAWMLVYMIINTTMSWPLSLCRYLSCGLIPFVVLSDICEKRRNLETGLIVVFSILFGIYMTGFFMQKQIM